MSRLESLCYTTKDVLNFEEAATFLGVTKSALYKMTHLGKLSYLKPAGKLIFFEKSALVKWVQRAKALSEGKIHLHGVDVAIPHPLFDDKQRCADITDQWGPSLSRRIHGETPFHVSQYRYLCQVAVDALADGFVLRLFRF